MLRLESPRRLITWSTDEMRVFVAEKGATLRQGDTRMIAPRMVVWFDKARSRQPGVRAAVVRVYAESVPRGEEGAGRVVLARGEEVQRWGAAYMEFTSRFSFVWDCPLREVDERRPSPLLLKAEELTAEVSPPKFWDTVPAFEAPELFELARRKLMANQVHLFREESTVVYVGDVHGEYGNLLLRADEAVLWYGEGGEDYEVYARGDVRVEPKPGVPRPYPEDVEVDIELFRLLKYASAQELYINPGRARALATDPEVRIVDPEAPEELVYVVRGEKAYLIDSQTLTVEEASVSTCQFARPHYRIQAEKAQVVRDPPSTVLNAWNTRFQVGEGRRTLMWLPFLGTDLTERAYLLTDYAVGSSNKFGFFLQTTWRPLDLTTRPSWMERWAVFLDYYGDRGPAVGTELDYAFGPAPWPRHEGMLRGYYVQDSADEDDTDLPVPKENRGRLHLRHRWQINRHWRADAEYYWLSDEGFLNEYFEEDFENEKTPESYLLARYLRDSTYLALLLKPQVNDFLTQVEQMPSADLQWMSVPWGRLVYDGTVTAGNYDRELSDLFTPAPPDAPSLWRLHTEHALSLPFTWGIFRLDPSVRVLGTWAGDSAWDGTSFGGSESRTGFGAGISASTNLYRTYATRSDLLDLNRLRHIVIPYVDLEALSVSGADSEEFIQMDSVDAIDSGTRATFGLRQRIQTKRRHGDRWRSVDWVELDVAYVSRSSDSVMSLLDEDYLRADFRMLLTEHVRLHSLDNRLAGGDVPDVYNVGVELDWLPQWSFRLDYDRIEDLTSTLTAELLYPLSARYTLMLLQRYEFDSAGTGDGENMETRVVFRRLLDQWVLDLGVVHEEDADEFAVIFGFGPKGWGLYRDLNRAAR